MKKSRFLALILVVAIMMLGAGYAYWTQDLTIENTITTGVLKVVFENPSLEVDEYMDWTESNVSSFEISDVDGYELELILEDAYPGAEAELSFDLVNQGTMKANVKGFGLAEESVNADLLLCKSVTVDGIFKDGNKTLSEVFENLNIGIEPEETAEVVIVLQIDPDADNESLPQNQEAISFTVNAMVHQYNDL